MRARRLRIHCRILLSGAVAFLCAAQSFAVFGVWRRHARRWAIVGTSVAVSNEQRQSAAAQQSAAAETAAAQSAASSAQAAAAAAQSAAATSKAAAEESAAPAQKTPQQKLQELDSLYKQGLITRSDYDAAKQKILAQIEQ